MKAKPGRVTRYLTKKEFDVLHALFRQGVTQKDALAEINMPVPTYNARVKEAQADADMPKSELTKAQKRNVKYVFQLLQAQGHHAKSLVKRLDLNDGSNVRWLLATLYPDRYSQRVAETRTLKDDMIVEFGDPSEAQTQASELLAEGDTPDVPGLED